MRYLGLDLGTTTLGVSITDRTNTIATPLKTIRFKENQYMDVKDALEEIVKEKQITDFVLGLPKNMNNSSGFAVDRSLTFQKWLESEFSLPIHFIDERLSTKEAEKILLSTDTSRKKRKEKIDALAATIILETYLKRKEEKNERRTNQ